MATFKIMDPATNETQEVEKTISSTCFEVHPDGSCEFHLRFGNEQISFNNDELQILDAAMEGRDKEEDWEDEEEEDWLDERDEYLCPECGEMRDVEEMCNPNGACDKCQDEEE